MRQFSRSRGCLLSCVSSSCVSCSPRFRALNHISWLQRVAEEQLAKRAKELQAADPKLDNSAARAKAQQLIRTIVYRSVGVEICICPSEEFPVRCFQSCPCCYLYDWALC